MKVYGLFYLLKFSFYISILHFHISSTHTDILCSCSHLQTFDATDWQVLDESNLVAELEMFLLPKDSVHFLIQKVRIFYK